MPEAEKIELRAELDPPGETRRQARMVVIWLVCLAMTVSLVIATRPDAARDGYDQGGEVERWRGRRVRFALLFGLALPALLTVWLSHRHRRGGAHARGIVVDVVDGELRIWGRGYGQRVRLQDAEVSERLVDVYSGRLGTWRQRRLRVRPKRPASAGGVWEIEIATVAEDADLDLDVRLEGGEGDCIEIGRQDYERLLLIVRAESQKA